jgi:tetratricopeptide (TPR) repeat protein
MAGALLQVGRLDEAREVAELAVDGHEQSRNILAQIAIRQNDIEAAELIVAEAIERRGTRLGPLMSLAELRFVQQRFDETLAVTDDMLAEFGERTDFDSISGLYHLRGSSFAHQGDLESSAEAFNREIELFPGSLDAYRSLALIQTTQGEAAAARATLELMMERNATPQASAMAVRAYRQLGNAATASRLLSEARQKWPDSPALREVG